MKRSSLHVLSIMCLVLLAGLAVASQGATWDLLGDWNESNPNGQWTYGRMDASYNWQTLTDHTSNWQGTGIPAWYYATGRGETPAVFKGNGSWVFPANRTGTHTPWLGETYCYSAVMWTASSNMSIDISGDSWIAYDPANRPEALKLLVNGTALINDVALPANGSEYQFAFSNIGIQAGQTVILAIKGTGDPSTTYAGPCGWDLKIDGITMVPEPSGMLGLGSSIIAFVGYALRRRRA